MTYSAKLTKKNRLKLFTALLCAAVLLLQLVSCSVNVKPVEPTEEETVVVGTVAGHDVYYDELRYLTLNYLDELSEKYEDVSPSSPNADEIRAELRDLVVAALSDSDYYAVAAMADEYYPGGSAAMLAEKKIVDATASEINELAEELGGKRAYFNELSANHMNDRLMRFYLSCESCATELIYILKDDFGILPSTEEELREALDSTALIRTNHLYLKGLTEENRKTCEEARRALLESDNREMEIILIKGKYHDADYTLTTTHGAYFSRYTSGYGDAYEEAAAALSVGGVSDVVEGEDGYYVILRMAPEKDYVTRNFDALASDYINSQFNIQLDAYRKANLFEFNEYGAGIDLLAIG